MTTAAATDCITPATFDNSNPGAIFAAGTTVSRAVVININRRKTPRKIPGVAESPRRGYIVTDRKLVGGNLIARDMLGHLRYWLEPDESGKPRSKRFHEGHYWEACSLKFWEQQLGCSRQEARTAIKALEKSGAVVRDVRPFGNWETEHYRLVLGVCGIKLRDTSTASSVAANPTCVASNTTLVASNTATSLKLPLEVSSSKSLNSVTEKNPVTTGTLEISQANSGKAEPQNQTLKPTPVEMLKTTPKLGNKEKKKSTPEVVEKVSPPKLAKYCTLFREAFEAKYTETIYVASSQITHRNFNTLMNNRVRAAIGDPTPFVLFVVEHWTDLRSKDLPLSLWPVMREVTLFIGPLLQAYDYHLRAPERAAEQRARDDERDARGNAMREAARAADAAAKAAKPKPATKEEVAAIFAEAMAELDAIKKGQATAPVVVAPAEPKVVEVPTVDPRLDDLPIDRDPWPLHSHEERAAAFRQWLAENPPKIAA
jgi:hypothetical protein